MAKRKTPHSTCGRADVRNAIALARQHGSRLHVAHLSTEEDLMQVWSAKEDGLPVTCEVTPHHLFLTEKDVERLGSHAIMKPSLGKESDRLALWRGLDLGVIDMITTDHAPHTLDEKSSVKPPFGVPGLETSLPLVLTAVAEGKLSMDRLVELVSTNPRKIFGLAVAQETYTEVDLRESFLIESSNLRTKCGWTPFNGMRVTGKVVKVVLRGETVFDGENVVGNPRGRVVFPSSKNG